MDAQPGQPRDLYDLHPTGGPTKTGCNHEGKGTYTLYSHTGSTVLCGGCNAVLKTVVNSQGLSLTVSKVPNLLAQTQAKIAKKHGIDLDEPLSPAEQEAEKRILGG